MQTNNSLTINIGEILDGFLDMCENSGKKMSPKALTQEGDLFITLHFFSLINGLDMRISEKYGYTKKRPEYDVFHTKVRELLNP